MHSTYVILPSTFLNGTLIVRVGILMRKKRAKMNKRRGTWSRETRTLEMHPERSRVHLFMHIAEFVDSPSSPNTIPKVNMG